MNSFTVSTAKTVTHRNWNSHCWCAPYLILNLASCLLQVRAAQGEGEALRAAYGVRCRGALCGELGRLHALHGGEAAQRRPGRARRGGGHGAGTFITYFSLYSVCMFSVKVSRSHTDFLLLLIGGGHGAAVVQAARGAKDSKGDAHTARGG